MTNVKTEISDKYKDLMHERTKTLEDISYLQNKMKDNDKKLSDCVAAARLFGVVLEDEKPIREAKPIHQGSLLPPDAAQTTIRDFALNALRQRFPAQLRAKDVMQIYQDTYKKKLHSKTVGMTLYRLSTENRVRREGWDWYYVPTPDEQKVIDGTHHD